MKCCNTELKLQDRQTEKEGKIFFYKCESCKRSGWGKNKVLAEKMFNESKVKINHSTDSYNYTMAAQNTQLAKIPDKPSALVEWSNRNMNALINQSARFIDKPATERMIKKNIQYASNLSGNAWDKIWSNEEGQESISNAIVEANYYGATLGEMGDLVPFGKKAEFIASVECFEHAMVNGDNAPFIEIEILPIHENDASKAKRVDDNFIVDIEYGIPRGEIVAVVVRGKRSDTGKYIGEVYDAERLLEKAADHSPSYRQYLVDKEDFNKMRIEGKLKEDEAGRPYIEKKFSTWTKKIYEHDIKNPYDGPDRPEMLRKVAGKSFFRKFMKIRNAVAMADEWGNDESLEDDATRDQAAGHILKQAAGQFVNLDPSPGAQHPEIKDAEIVVEKNKPVSGPTLPPAEKNKPVKEKEVEKKEPPQFDECEDISEL